MTESEDVIMQASSNAASVDEIDDGVYRELQLLRERILHSLEIFPFLSSSMIHMSIGTSTPRGLWKPVLERLVEDGVVLVTEIFATTPNNRTQTYTIFHLASRTYQPANEQIRIRAPANNHNSDDE